MQHHSTIRKYTAALLNVFNDLEIQYRDSLSALRTKNVPVAYGPKEKFDILSSLSDDQIKSGNLNVLPRASLGLSTIVKADARVKNKNAKINLVSGNDNFEFSYNSVPYELTYELSIICRGMNEASMLIEQIAPKFNPTLEVDVWDVDNLSEPTRVPVKLLDIGITGEEYEELSANLITVDFGLSIQGNLYQPIKTIDRIKELKIYLNQHEGDLFSRKSIMGWDVNTAGTPENGTIISGEDTTTYAPSITDIVPEATVIVGANNLDVIYDDEDNKFSELTFEWSILQGDATVVGDNDSAVLTVNAIGTIEVQAKITDAYGNFTSLDKTFIVS